MTGSPAQKMPNTVVYGHGGPLLARGEQRADRPSRAITLKTIALIFAAA